MFDDEDTLLSISTDPSIQRYTEEEVDTIEVIWTEKECRAEAADKQRLGSHEAEGFWLLMAHHCKE